MSLTETYMRVLRAETLLSAGREKEAVADLIIALPVIEREAALVDGVAALTLLKESIRRQRADHDTVMKLRAAFKGR